VPRICVGSLNPAHTIVSMISTVNPDENLMAARLLDYFSSRTPWHRTLWNAGPVLALREVLEASEAQNLGHLSEKSIRGAVTTALRLLKDDPGIGSATERTALAVALTLNGEPRDEISYKGMEYEQIEELLNRATPLYLERWRTPYLRIRPLQQSAVHAQ
jgi:hypothetical protein